MSSYASTYATQAAPESWETVSYTVRRPGNAAWESNISTFDAAQRSRDEADRVCRPGHQVYAHQRGLGLMTGKTRIVSR